jgi:hypothetical protein
MIYHLEYRIDNGRKQHIYALRKICEKRKKQLEKEHGDKIRFSRIKIA